jgi:hypothetical protein
MVVASAQMANWFARRGRPADGFHRTTVDVRCEVKNLDFKTD